MYLYLRPLTSLETTQRPQRPAVVFWPQFEKPCYLNPFFRCLIDFVSHYSVDLIFSHFPVVSRCTVRTARPLAWWWRCWWPRTPPWRSSCRFLSGRTWGRSANAAWRISNTSLMSWMRWFGSRTLPSETRPITNLLTETGAKYRSSYWDILRYWPVVVYLTEFGFVEREDRCHKNADCRTWWTVDILMGLWISLWRHQSCEASTVEFQLYSTAN